VYVVVVAVLLYTAVRDVKVFTSGGWGSGDVAPFIHVPPPPLILRLGARWR
jgi:hypothetical protein